MEIGLRRAMRRLQIRSVMMKRLTLAGSDGSCASRSPYTRDGIWGADGRLVLLAAKRESSLVDVRVIAFWRGVLQPDQRLARFNLNIKRGNTRRVARSRNPCPLPPAAHTSHGILIYWACAITSGFRVQCYSPPPFHSTELPGRRDLYYCKSFRLRLCNELELVLRSSLRVRERNILRLNL